MMDRQIVGIDHGNRNIKTGNTIFLNNINELSTKPDDLSRVLEYKERFFEIGGVPEEKKPLRDKTLTDDYYFLTLAAIAQEFRKRGIRQTGNEIMVRLAVGLPPRWYQEQMKSFREYLSREKEITFRYQNIPHKLRLEGTRVYMQGFAAITNILDKCTGTTLLVDIGGGTMDTVEIVNKVPDRKRTLIDNYATIKCITHINEILVAELGEKAPPSLIEQIMREGTCECDKEYLRVITRELSNYGDYVYKWIESNGYNLRLVKIIFMGGGACILKNFGDNENKNVSFITDIHANAKGYEATERRIMHIKQQKHKMV